jgi:hypothetical protein
MSKKTEEKGKKGTGSGTNFRKRVPDLALILEKGYLIWHYFTKRVPDLALIVKKGTGSGTEGTGSGTMGT